MRLPRHTPIAAAIGLILTTGCAQRPYYAYAPPPPPRPLFAHLFGQVSPMVDIAQREGFAAGQADGARDAYSRSGYRPQHDRNFRNPPGYDRSLGPREPYREYFRRAYLQGYNRTFGRS